VSTFQLRLPTGYDSLLPILITACIRILLLLLLLLQISGTSQAELSLVLPGLTTLTSLLLTHVTLSTSAAAAGVMHQPG
jgi:hypothetical protein